MKEIPHFFSVTIFDLWRYFAFSGNPKERPCRSPFRPDINPSFSVREDGIVYFDFAEQHGGNVVDFAQRAMALESKQEALQWLKKFSTRDLSSFPIAQQREITRLPKILRPVTLPPLRPGAEYELQDLAQLRFLGLPGLRLATARKLLSFTELENQIAWVVADQTCFNAQARTLTGVTWSNDNKVKGFVGNCGSWPIGVIESMPFANIVLCEGTPDR
jgi:hypothetical protein